MLVLTVLKRFYQDASSHISAPYPSAYRQCMCGDKVVCKEEPVFESKDVEGNPEFNHFARIKSGKKIPVSDYVRWRGSE